MRANERIDPFTGSDNAVEELALTATIPSNSPYYVKFPFLPREDDPTTVVVRLADTTSSPNPDSDTWLDEANPTTNYGTDTTVLVGTTAGGLKGRAGFHFDLSALSGTVRRAYFRANLETVGGSAQSIGIHALTAALTEGTATWNNMAANHNLVAADVKSINGAGFYTWDVTALVASWVSGAATNYGLMLKNASEATANTRRTFSSRNHGTSSLRPQLVIFIEGTRFSEVASTITPVSMEVAVDYEQGWMRFNTAQAGQAISFDAYDTGAPPDVDALGLLSREIDADETTDLNVLSGATHTVTGVETYANVLVQPGGTLTIATGFCARLNVAGDFELFGTLNIDSKGGAAGAAYQSGGGFGAMGGRPSSTSFASQLERGMLIDCLISRMMLYVTGNPSWPPTPYQSTTKVKDVLGWLGVPWFIGVLQGGVLVGMSGGEVTDFQAWLEIPATDGDRSFAEVADYLISVMGAQGGAGGGGNLTAGTAGTGTGAGTGGEAGPYNTTHWTKFVHPFPGGGGGGSSSAAGGAGGGAILIQVAGLTYLDPAATIYARGAAAAGTNAGGGAGGSVRWRCNRIEQNSVTPVVTGGAGNGTGGTGAAGWYVFEDLEP